MAGTDNFHTRAALAYQAAFFLIPSLCVIKTITVGTGYWLRACLVGSTMGQAWD